ncbi:MAG TPA: PfkB family carbohydrate kinase, partial [Microlunatus sp.]|nr:PfkB family carbohydrate kinase [Microlunatus sp.]
AESVFIGRVGDDPHGHRYVDRLGRFGVDTERLSVDPAAPTGTAIIYLDSDGENMIVVAPGANAEVDASDLERLDDCGPGDVLVLQLELNLDVVAAAARKAHRQGARVIINLAPYADLPADVLELADPVIANEHEAELLSRSGLAPRSILVTLGTEGSRWGDLRVPAERVEVVDTTGAGDAYCGTLAARLCLGDEPLAAMHAASAAASHNVTHPGAQPPLPRS